MPHCTWLGLALAPTGAYLAVTGQFAWAPVLLSLAVLCWVSGFDIIYPMQDERFDREHNLFSIPAVLGGKNALMVSNLLHFLSACLFFQWVLFRILAIFILPVLYFFWHCLFISIQLLSPMTLAK